MAHPVEPHRDPRRWFAVAVVIVSVLIPVLDNTILYVAIPTIQHEFHTELTTLQWVITGYSLTFATLLIIGGRLGDIFGHRRMFVLGVAIFGVGSLLASLSTSVPTLFLGEALIEGIGASLMIPATLAILSTTFVGQERAFAFAAWGAVAGIAVSFGPVVGGFLTTDFSWRWAFRINVILAPIIIVGALLFMHKDVRSARRPRIDVPGALLIAAASFTLIFALSEGTTYGWWNPIKSATFGGWEAWPKTRPISLIPFAFLVSGALIAWFIAVERRKEQRHEDPIFELGLLRVLTFRWGLLTTVVLAMGQFGLLFVIPVFLQNGEHLTALETGKWMIPQGVMIAIGAPIGGWLARRVSITSIVRTGLAMEAVGLAWVAFAVAPGASFWSLLPGMLLFGTGIGFASSQLVNVILHDIPGDKSGVASGTNNTVRQVGLALGIATFASLINTLTIRHATSAVKTASIAAATKAGALPGLHAQGVNFSAPPGTSAHDADVLSHIMDAAVAAGARPALFFAAIVVTLGTALSFLIPKVSVAHESIAETSVDALEGLDVGRAPAID
jgi:EmrB/QacA subfamily drug resistance transporter